VFRRLALAGLGALAPLGFLVGLAAPASATATALAYSSGQTITLVVPANSTFAAPNDGNGISIVECSAPDGAIPTQTSSCDDNTIQGNLILPNADGSFSYDNYEVFALPDSITLVEAPGGPVCGDTASTECILYIGDDPNDFAQPHQWSEPFFVQANSDDGGENPGDTPLTIQGTSQPGAQLAEVSTVLLLPILALAFMGGLFLISKKRAIARGQSETTSADLRA
jgi:hypothetical protein